MENGLSIGVLVALYAPVGGLLGWVWRLWLKQRDDNEKLTAKIVASEKESGQKIAALELKLAGSYHNKEELKDVMAEQLAPLRDAIKELKDMWMRAYSNGNGNGHGRGT